MNSDRVKRLREVVRDEAHKVAEWPGDWVAIVEASRQRWAEVHNALPALLDVVEAAKKHAEWANHGGYGSTRAALHEALRTVEEE